MNDTREKEHNRERVKMKALTAGGYTVERISTADRGAYYLVRSPHGSKVALDSWNPQARAEIRTLAQLGVVLARHDQDIPEEMKEN